MVKENGEWILCGPSWNSDKCLHSVDEAIDLINKIGFLPLFKNETEGFSLEEHTAPEYWWSDKPDRDPWEWRTVIVQKGDIAYGKFFGKKAGFVSRKWIPYFANYRRDGYDFDALYEDGKASRKMKLVMDCFMREGAKSAIISNELKQTAGFSGGGEKGFDTVISNLMMMFYLCNSDFVKRKNKNGIEYGWDVAVYSMPESLWGADFVTSQYSKSAAESFETMVQWVKNIFPKATDKQIKQIIK